MTIVSPVRLSQIQTKENGIFTIGDNSLTGGAVLNIIRGSDNQGGIINVENLLKFSNGSASANNPAVYTGGILFSGSVFTNNQIFERTIQCRYQGDLNSSRLNYITQNTVTESQTPEIGSAVQSWFTTNKNILEGSYSFELVDGSIVYKGKDDSQGNIVDNGSSGGGMVVSGSINYTMGQVSITLNNAVSAQTGNIEQKFVTQKEIFSIENSIDNIIDIKNDAVLKVSVRTDTSIVAPIIGMLIFNPIIGKLQVFAPSGWQIVGDSGGGGGITQIKPRRDIFDITTSSVGPFNLSFIPLGQTLTEKVAGIKVFVNGVLVRPVEDYSYDVINNSIVFVNPLEVGDELQILYLEAV